MTDTNDPPETEENSISSVKNQGPEWPIDRTFAERFRLVSELSCVGSQPVYKAFDLLNAGKPVAVKRLPALDLMSEAARERLEREVAVSREFDHPNLINILDFRITPDDSYVVMELLPTTLAQRIYEPEKPLTFEEVLFIVFDVAKGVAAAHSQGILHRHLRPENIYLTTEGRAKVAEFGLADDGILSSNAANIRFPQPYMAPEQFRVGPIDERADVYSLGIIAFEMINRKRPFPGRTYLETARDHETLEIPAFYNKHSNFRKWFETFVWRCGEKKPKARFQSMHEVERYLTHELRKLKLIGGEPERTPWFLRSLAKLLGEG